MVSEMDRVPVCMIVDDPGPFFNAGTTGHPGEILEASNSFYRRFGEWALENGVKGKFSVVPVCGGVAAIDGSLGEYPGHSLRERLEWIEIIKVVYQPNWTITPEIITHLMPWDIVNEEAIVDTDQRENEYFAELTVEQKTAYITYAMQKLNSAGITAGGCTMCWSMPAELNADFGKATLDAVAEVYGPKNVMIFNDCWVDPAVVYKNAEGYVAVKTPPAVGDIDGLHYASGVPEPERIASDVDAFISDDGESGTFVDVIRSGKPLIFLTHIQSLHTNGMESGFEVYRRAVERLNRFYADRIQWMSGEEIVGMVAGS
jgi:hypothetical protein